MTGGLQTTIATFAACAVAGGVGTAAMRGYALRRQIIDVPNHRSSHTRPTPRGGGMAIVATMLLAVVVLWVLGVIAGGPALALVGGGSMVAAVGWLDDRGGVRPSVRAAVHFAAAILAVACLRGLPVVTFGDRVAHVGIFGAVIGVLGVVWAVNLYNFMDGIDGLAGSEAVLAGGFIAAMLYLAGASGLAAAAAALAGASLGFLVFNWSPARIFMGDVGSGFVGYVFGVLALASERVGAVPIILVALVLGAFVLDATLTLARRVLAGEVWYESHRAHAYQRAVQSGLSHATVASTCAALTIVLGALAMAASRGSIPVWAAEAAGAALLAVVYLAVERRRPYTRPTA